MTYSVNNSKRYFKMSFSTFELKTPDGKLIRMAELAGKLVLIVNTATKCGLAPQFEGLEKLHQKYNQHGLVVIGTPCNQFFNQEPETNDSMEETCLINHGVTFQLTEKINVNGRDTHPLYNYLKKELGGIFGRRIKWNFTKFLINQNGTPVKRFSPTTNPDEIENEIKKWIVMK